MKLAPLAIALVSLAAQPVHAQQFGLLSNAPITKMTKQDLVLMTKNYTDALNGNPDGHTSAWTNSATGASGTATPLSSGTEKGIKCRRIEITNSAGGMSGRSEHQACLTKAGWRFAS